MAGARTYRMAPFVSESHILAMSGVNSRDKAYGLIRCEAKLDTGVAGMDCSGKGVM